MPLLPSVTWSSGSTILEATILEPAEFVARGRIPVARL